MAAPLSIHYSIRLSALRSRTVRTQNVTICHPERLKKIADYRKESKDLSADLRAQVPAVRRFFDSADAPLRMTEPCLCAFLICLFRIRIVYAQPRPKPGSPWDFFYILPQPVPECNAFTDSPQLLRKKFNFFSGNCAILNTEKGRRWFPMKKLLCAILAAALLAGCTGAPSAQTTPRKP